MAPNLGELVGTCPLISNRFFKAYGRDTRKFWETGAFRLGKLALLAVLGTFAGRMPGRMQFRTHP